MASQTPTIGIAQGYFESLSIRFEKQQQEECRYKNLQMTWSKAKYSGYIGSSFDTRTVT